MERLNLVYLTSILNRPVIDELDDNVGILKDIYVNGSQGYPKVIGYKVDKSGDIYNYEFKDIEFYEDTHGVVHVEVRGVRDIIPQRFGYQLNKDILAQNVRDSVGKIAFKAQDICLAQLEDGMKVLGVSQRVHKTKKSSFLGFLRPAGKPREDSLILWDDLEGIKGKESVSGVSHYKELAMLHPADLAEVMEEVENHYRTRVFEALDEEIAADALEEMKDTGVQAGILSTITETKAQEILEIIPNDEIAEILEAMDEEARERIMAKLITDDAREVKEIMGYPDEEAGSFMAKEFLTFLDSITVKDAREIVRDLSDEFDADEMYYIFVTDHDGILQGFISISDLVQQEDDCQLRDIMETHVEEINISDRAETAVDLAIKYELLQIPVVDDDFKLVGVINIHDIIDDFLAPLWKRKN